MTTPRDKIKTIIKEEHQKTPNCSLAVVNATYEDEYCCDIMVLNNNNQRLGAYYGKVPLPMIGGVTYSMPHVGDKVLVEFLGGDTNYPLIVAAYPTTTRQLYNMSRIQSSLLNLLSDIE